ncbi:hypothetical protein BGZ50_000701, partial [Haplosporangium sp. Z 11]
TNSHIQTGNDEQHEQLSLNMELPMRTLTHQPTVLHQFDKTNQAYTNMQQALDGTSLASGLTLFEFKREEASIR